MNIRFIGYGNIAKALARGLVNQKHYKLSASSPSLTPGITKEKIRTYKDNKEAINEAEIIILAVKPAIMASVLAEIKPFLSPQTLLISVAAGLPTPWFASQLNAAQAVIRTMPNTPAAVGLSATPLFANAMVSDAHRQSAEQIFGGIGITTWAKDESEMDSYTALSGSGPAYVYLFMEALIAAAQSLGLDAEIAKNFTLQTVQGALKLAQDSDLSLSELRTKVTSPNGTTAAALEVLDGHLAKLMLTAIQTAKARSKALGENKS